MPLANATGELTLRRSFKYLRMLFAPIALSLEQRDHSPESMPFLSTDDRNPATLVADSGHTIGMLDHLESHLSQVSPNFIGANASAGQFGMQQFQRFTLHLIAQHGDTIEQFRRTHRPNAG